MEKSPDHPKPPAYLSKNPPVPKPAESAPQTPPEQDRLDPTRYGDWENKGLAIDF